MRRRPSRLFGLSTKQPWLLEQFRYKELMALAVAFTTQCPYCIEVHAKKAREADASEQEIAEVVAVAAALRAGAAITHGTHAFT